MAGFCHSQKKGFVVVDEATGPGVFLFNRTRDQFMSQESNLRAELGSGPGAISWSTYGVWILWKLPD